MDKITILDPTAEMKKDVVTRALYLENLAGKRIAFVSNEGWLCMPVMWRQLERRLREMYKVSDVFKVPVPMQKAAPAEVLDEVVRTSDAAITGLAI